MNTFEKFKNENFSKNLQKNALVMKKILPSDDILIYSFLSGGGIPCAVVYADGMVNKQLIGDLAARPLSRLSNAPLSLDEVKKSLLSPN